MSAVFAAGILCTIAVPLAGLLLPLSSGIDAGRVWSEVARTGLNTLIYAAGAGVVATSFGFLLALCVGRSDRLRTAVVGVSLAMFAIPPSLRALGIVYAAANSPAWLDWLTRSRLTVCIELGFRLVPVAGIVALRSWGTVSQTWTHAAALHGVPLTRYQAQVLLRYFWPTMALTVLFVGLLATADIGTVLLVHPPGRSSFPLAIFTVMANAPESLVSSLCLAYVLLAFGGVALLSIGVGGRTR